MKRHTVKHNPQARNRYSLQALAHAVIQEETAKRVIEQVRDEFDLLDPIDSADREENLAEDREPIRERLAVLLSEAQWPQYDTICLLNYVFRPEQIRADVFDFLCAGDHPEKEDLVAFHQLGKALHALLAGMQLDTLIGELLIDLLTEHAIEGHMTPPKDMPSWFTGGTFSLPFLFEDTVVITIASRFADIGVLAADFKHQFMDTFHREGRQSYPRNPERDLWIVAQHIEICDTLPDQQAEIARMAQILDTDEGDVTERTALDELLRQFQETQWAHELDHYDLDTNDGRRAAKNFLKQILHRNRTRFRAILDEVDQAP
jgi:hypothetical protein